MTAYRHIARHAVHRSVHPEGEGIIEGMNVRDGVCIALAFIALGGVAMWIEKETALDGEICFDVMGVCAAHPLHIALKRLLSLVI